MTDGPEMERLQKRLFENPDFELLDISITPGVGPLTKEGLAKEINDALDQLAAGSAVRGAFQDDAPRVDVAGLEEPS